MDWNHGKVQPILIDEELLHTAVIEQLPRDEVGNFAKAKGIHFNEVLSLHLGLRNIVKIDSLWEFTSMTKLDLNHNLIKKIEGLDRLVNLKRLNLSGNHIEQIEGLESLLMLQVLNLSDNKITVIENMDTLEKLTIFCIANNLLDHLENVLYLRKFKNLFTLNLSGNPVCETEDYILFITACFPNLLYLNYRYIDEKIRNEAAVKFANVIKSMTEEELEMKQAAEIKQKHELHRDAFVEFLDGPFLFKSMLKEDPEADKLHTISGVDTLLQIYEQKMVDLCTQLFEIGLAEHKRRQTQVNLFFSGHTETVKYYQSKASQILDDFEQQHKRSVEELQELSDEELQQAKVDECNEKINILCKSLMTLHFQLMGQLEDIVKKFDSNISNMVAIFTETALSIFAQCRDLEDSYHENVREIAIATLEMAAKGNFKENMSTDVKLLFRDKDAVMDALATAHDNHLTVINDRETQLVTRIESWEAALVKGIQDKDFRQSRARLSGIHRYEDYLREELENTEKTDE